MSSRLHRFRRRYRDVSGTLASKPWAEAHGYRRTAAARREEDPALGYNLDAGWTLLQREYPPVAIHKIKRQLLNLHMRDIDGTMGKFPHVGEGVMDFKAIVDTLKQVGFDGYASIEQDKHPGDMKETCRRYLRVKNNFAFPALPMRV